MKTVLVTGASGGIGAATASLFAHKGYKVILHYRHSAAAARMLKESLQEAGCDVQTYAADIGDSQQVREMVRNIEAHYGGIDILINNAGISSQKLFTDISFDEWNEMIRVNLTGTFNCCQSAVRGMIRRKSGCIVNVSSIWGITGASCEVHYSATKAGIIGLTKALAKEVGPSNIRVNCVAPGFISTSMNNHLSIDDIQSFTEETAIGRIGTPEEVAQTIYFLSTDASSYITGQVITPDGGYCI